MYEFIILNIFDKIAHIPIPYLLDIDINNGEQIPIIPNFSP